MRSRIGFLVRETSGLPASFCLVPELVIPHNTRNPCDSCSFSLCCCASQREESHPPDVKLWSVGTLGSILAKYSVHSACCCLSYTRTYFHLRTDIPVERLPSLHRSRWPHTDTVNANDASSKVKVSCCSIHRTELEPIRTLSSGFSSNLDFESSMMKEWPIGSLPLDNSQKAACITLHKRLCFLEHHHHPDQQSLAQTKKKHVHEN